MASARRRRPVTDLGSPSGIVRTAGNLRQCGWAIYGLVTPDGPRVLSQPTSGSSLGAAATACNMRGCDRAPGFRPPSRSSCLRRCCRRPRSSSYEQNGASSAVLGWVASANLTGLRRRGPRRIPLTDVIGDSPTAWLSSNEPIPHRRNGACSQRVKKQSRTRHLEKFLHGRERVLGQIVLAIDLGAGPGDHFKAEGAREIDSPETMNRTRVRRGSESRNRRNVTPNTPTKIRPGKTHAQ
jgi:hypothetical protein